MYWSSYLSTDSNDGQNIGSGQVRWTYDRRCQLFAWSSVAVGTAFLLMETCNALLPCHCLQFCQQIINKVACSWQASNHTNFTSVFYNNNPQNANSLHVLTSFSSLAVVTLEGQLMPCNQFGFKCEAPQNMEASSQIETVWHWDQSSR